MSMTVGEANAANVVARRLLSKNAYSGPDGDNRVIEALEILVAGAYKRLMAGMTPQDVRPAFEEMKTRQNNNIETDPEKTHA